MSRRAYATGLGAVLILGTLSAWSPAVWAVSAPQAGILLLSLIWFTERLRGWGAWKRNRLILPVVLAAGWGIVQLALATTVYRFPTWNATLSWTAHALFFWLALQNLQSSRIRDFFLLTLLWFGFVLAVVSILHGGATFGPFVYKNQFAAFLELLLPIAVYRMMAEPRRALPYALCASILAACVVASASRTGVILIAAEIIVLLLAGCWRGMLTPRQLGSATLVMTALVATFIAAAGWESTWAHFQEPNPSYTRAKLLHSTLAMTRDRPLTGYGMGTWRVVYPAYASFDNSLTVNEAHNDWAQWAAEGGVPFLLIMLWIAIGSISAAWRSLWGIGAIAVLLHALVDYPTREPALGALLFTFLGAIAASDTTQVSARSSKLETCLKLPLSTQAHRRN